MGHKLTLQVAIQVEDIDEAIAWPRDVIVALRILFRISHEQLVVDVANAEWREAAGDAAICERFHKVKLQVVHFDRAIAEVGRINKVARAVVADCQALVDGPKPSATRAGPWAGVVHRQDRVRGVHSRAPSADGAVFRSEDETARARLSAGGNDKAARTVEHDACRRGHRAGPTVGRRGDGHHER